MLNWEYSHNSVRIFWKRIDRLKPVNSFLVPDGVHAIGDDKIRALQRSVVSERLS